jgi:hypothetical protein
MELPLSSVRETREISFLLISVDWAIHGMSTVILREDKGRIIFRNIVILGISDF